MSIVGSLVQSSGGGGTTSGTLASISSTDSPYTVPAGTTHVEVDATAGDIIVTLPNIALSAASEITFMRSDSVRDNSINISGDANISGLSTKNMSVKNIPDNTPYDFATNAAGTRSYFYNPTDFDLDGGVLRAVWIKPMIDGTTSFSVISGTPNAANWDFTVLQLFANTTHNEHEWQRLELTTPVVIANGDIFGISLYAGDATALGYSNPTRPIAGHTLRYTAAGYSTNQTNIATTSLTRGVCGLMGEIEAAGQNDVFKLVGGSAAWYETIA